MEERFCWVAGQLQAGRGGAFSGWLGRYFEGFLQRRRGHGVKGAFLELERRVLAGDIFLEVAERERNQRG